MAKKNTGKPAPKPQASKAPPKKPGKPVVAAPAPAPKPSGARDGFGASPSAGTGKMHLRLLAAAKKGAPVPTAEFAADRNAHQNHLQGLRKAGYIERVEGGWRLTKLGLSVLTGKAPSMGYFTAQRQNGYGAGGVAIKSDE
jgi:hypothetical protein